MTRHMTRRARSASERLYGALLRLFPADFQRDFGADMRELFRDHLRTARRRAGWRGVAMLWFRTIPDLLATGLHEHEDAMLQAMVQDARYAVRILLKNPVFTAVAVAIVALGAGAVSTIYAVANATILRPVPGVERPQDVVAITRRTRERGTSHSASYPFYERLAAESKTMSGVAAWGMAPTTISTGGEGMLAQSNLVTANYFDVLGVRPALGRFFVPDEGRVNSPSPVVVISHELWQRRFAGDSSIAGHEIFLNGQRFTIIGVAPPRFNGLFAIARTDAWVPMPMQAAVRRGGDLLDSPGASWLELVGRVAPRTSREVAHQELAAIAKRFATTVETGRYANVVTFDEVDLATETGLPADAARPVLAFFIVLLSVSGLVLLIASVNVASMLLARSVARRQEIAVRIALGAGRRRIMRQLLTESIVLFGAGGAVGAALSFLSTRLLSRIPLPLDVPLSIDPRPDARVLLVTLAVSLTTGIVFGMAPALRGSRGDVAAALRGDTSGGGRARSRLRTALVAAQVAASLLLLTTSGLFVRALARGHQVDPGYDIDHVTTAALDVSLSGYDTVRARTFYATLRDRVKRLPGVTGVAYTRVVPLSMNNMGYSVSIPGRANRDDWSYANLVDGEYFDVLQQPILAGRALLPTDAASAPNVAVVSQLFVDRYWPGQNGLGRTFKLDSATTVTVVGITRNVEFSQLSERSAPFVYLPLAQHWRPEMNLLVRTTGDASQLIAPIRAEVRALDARLPAPVTITLERSAAVVLLPQRFAVIVTASLGFAGLLLAAIGLYGVLSFSTAQRGREIGVRMALGAARGNVVGLIVREGMGVVAIGAAIGLVLAALASRALAPFLFGVNPLDPATFVGMTALLGVVALAASLLPARRAARADPLVALRQD
jgi:putative ABC transport system permease protein